MLSYLFTIAAVGIAETAYLIRKRKEASKPICPIGGGCEIVLTSKYNRTLGMHNDILGFLFYLGVAALFSALVIDIGDVSTWNMIIAGMLVGATAMSLRFFYLQWQVIHAWCFWCLMSMMTILCMDALFFGFILF